MPRICLLTRCPELAASMRRYCRHVLGLDAPSLPAFTGPAESTLDAFRRLSDALESCGDGTAAVLQDTLVVADGLDEDFGPFERLDPLDTKARWGAVVAMLALTFPEAHWSFLTPSLAGRGPMFRLAHHLDPRRAGRSVSRLVRLRHDRFTPLFDATGLRNGIRSSVRARADVRGRAVAPYVPLRARAACAIDDETAYAYFNAYAAFRFGYRCFAVSSYAIFRLVRAGGLCSPEVALVFDDFSLNFPDRPDGRDLVLSLLESRARAFPPFRGEEAHVFITAGTRGPAAAETRVRNRNFLRRLADGGARHVKVLFKPVSGIFDLWTRSRLKERLRATGGRAPAFAWPPQRAAAGEVVGHSAPGRLLEVAGRLIRRAEGVLRTAESVPGAVYGAVLATEAQELLGNQTPTTGLEALALKHQLEVVAECLFYGVAYNFDVESRFAELAREVRALGVWFHPATRGHSEQNALGNIINRLVLRFRSFNQFDEENACLQEALRLRWAAYNPLRWYLLPLLRSTPLFVLAVSLWVLAFGLVFRGLGPAGVPLWRWVAYSALTFLGFGLPGAGDVLPPAVPLPFSGPFLAAFVTEIALAFTHLGILISRVSSLIARR